MKLHACTHVNMYAEMKVTNVGWAVWHSNRLMTAVGWWQSLCWQATRSTDGFSVACLAWSASANLHLQLTKLILLAKKLILHIFIHEYDYKYIYTCLSMCNVHMHLCTFVCVCELNKSLVIKWAQQTCWRNHCSHARMYSPAQVRVLWPLPTVE